MKFSVRLIISFVISLGFVYTGCSEQPVQFEANKVPFVDITNGIRQSTLLADSAHVYYQEGSTGLSPNVVLGRFNGQKCSILLQFSGFPVNVTVETAKLSLGPNLVYGSSAERFTATVHEITSGWDEESIPDITYDTRVLASFEVSSSLNDTNSVTLPNGIVQRWIESEADTTIFEKGIYITLNDANFAKQFSGLEGIKLTVDYLEDDSLQSFSLSPSFDSYTVEGQKDLGSEFIMSNFGSHRIIMKFNLDDIPEEATINFAQLVMKLDTDKSFIGIASANDFKVNKIESDSWNKSELLFSSFVAASGVLDIGFSTAELQIDMTGLTQQWINDKTLNKGMLLSSFKENQDLSLFSFLFDTSDSLMQPYLRVHYTTFNPY